MEDEVIINVEHLTKDYGYGRGVFDVSIKVHKGECYGYLGPNGAGKSTTIRHIMGFSKPTKGKIEIFGLNSFNNTHKILAKVGYLPGEPAIPLGLDGMGFLRMMQDMRQERNDERLNYLLGLFRLNPNVSVKSMSLGEKRKLAVVAAFMNDPDVLILDEPTSGLDPVMQQVFIHFIIDEKKRGKTILLSSHISFCMDPLSFLAKKATSRPTISVSENSKTRRNTPRPNILPLKSSGSTKAARSSPSKSNGTSIRISSNPYAGATSPNLAKSHLPFKTIS